MLKGIMPVLIDAVFYLKGIQSAMVSASRMGRSIQLLTWHIDDKSRCFSECMFNVDFRDNTWFFPEFNGQASCFN
jgi:hypothetical protein